MCYSVSYLTHKNEVYARRLGIADDARPSFYRQMDTVRSLLGTAWFRSGFEFQGVPVLIAHKSSFEVHPAFWGLIPRWAKTADQQRKIIQHTLNARIETLDEKPAFRNSVSKRCVVLLDGFFEYQLKEGKKQPKFIRHSDHRPILVGAIFEQSPDTIPFSLTVSIVTRTATEYMTEIHNDSVSGEARMPLILETDTTEIWCNAPFEEARSFATKHEPNDLYAIPVPKLIGKDGVGNTPNAQMELKG